MKIESIRFKNFASYGNEIQEIAFDKNIVELFLTLGKNGFGKCLSKETKIDVDIQDPKVKKQFIEFLNKKNNH